MIKKIITVSAIIALSCCFFGCKSDEEKALEKAAQSLEKAASDAQDAADEAKKSLNNIKLP